MNTTPLKQSRVAMVAVAMAAIIFGTLSSNCDELEDNACESDLRARVDSLNAAATSFIAASEALELEIGTACHNIATDLEADDVPAADDVQAVCGAASAALDAEVGAGATIEIAIEGGGCEVNAEAQFSCEAECSVEGECDPGTVEVRCDPGELSGECSGECSASAVCEGSAEIAANCDGSCSGNCTGTCEGDDVSGAVCDGRCDGECTGECTLAADASINCGVDVDCRGGCSVEYTAPHCEGTVEPPQCDMDMDCQAGCDGQASVEAECTPPSVSVVVGGGAHANLESTLATNMPAILNGVRYKGQLLLDSAQDLVGAAGNVAGELGNAATCAAAVGAEVVGNLTAVAEASASVSVSFEASASVSGSAGTE